MNAEKRGSEKRIRVHLRKSAAKITLEVQAVHLEV
jgi:hypothetical protein